MKGATMRGTGIESRGLRRIRGMALARLIAFALLACVCSAGPALAGPEPGSLCLARQSAVFASSFEPLDGVAVIGVEDCGSLEEYLDPDLEDGVPVTIPLYEGRSYDFAIIRTLPGETFKGDYTADGVPAFGSFDAENGVLTLNPSCVDEGSHLVEFDIVLDGGSGTTNPLSVEYEVNCASFDVLGLDFENDGAVSNTPHHGTWADSNGDGAVDQPVKVREGRSPSSPWEAYVVASDGKPVTLDPQSTLPSHISVSGNMIAFGTGGLEGESGSLEFLVCDDANQTDCRTLTVPYQYVARYPVIVGLSYSEQNGTIDNPNDQGAFYAINEIDCQLSEIDERWVVAEPYDFEYNFDIANSAPNMGINGGTGRISFNPTCGQAGQTYFPQVQVTGSGGEGAWVSSMYQVY